MGVIVLVRHGQASFGKRDYDALSRTGTRQATVLGDALRHRLAAVDRVECGAMTRHRQTAEHCVAAMGSEVPDWQASSDWNEYNHEEIIQRYQPRYKSHTLMLAEMASSGQPRKAFQRMFAKAMARWMAGDHDHQYAESWPMFQQRCIAALEATAGHAGKGKTVMVFTSGGVISVVCQHLLGLHDEATRALSWRLVNGGLTKVIVSPSGLHLSAINDHAAFEARHGELITYR